MSMSIMPSSYQGTSGERRASEALAVAWCVALGYGMRVVSGLASSGNVVVVRTQTERYVSHV